MITSGQYDRIKRVYETTPENKDIWTSFCWDLMKEENIRKSHTTYGLMKNPSSYKSMKVEIKE